MITKEIILKKRMGGELTREELAFFVNGAVSGAVDDAQTAAMMMAICFNSMTDRETADLTELMAESGDMSDLSYLHGASADKHSTGGVGDKTSLIVAPLAASLGVSIAKMSGRGLGHTGGTVDKLESIPGYRTEMPAEEFREQVKRVGIAVVGQSGNMAPADKKFYAIRDETGTVDSIPLIASSIMSKKFAAGDKNIVLDVKTGSGAFMTTLDGAEALAKAMIAIGRAAGRNVRAVISDMSVPLGTAVGNAMEVAEAVRLLRGEETDERLKKLCVVLAANMAELALGISNGDAMQRAEDSLDSGRAYAKFLEWTGAQGGDVSVFDDLDAFTRCTAVEPVVSDKDGFITAMDAAAIGEVTVLLGAGRQKKTDSIDMKTGVEVLKKTGDSVKRGETLARLHLTKPQQAAEAAGLYMQALTIGDIKPQVKSDIILEIL